MSETSHSCVGLGTGAGAGTGAATPVATTTDADASSTTAVDGRRMSMDELVEKHDKLLKQIAKLEGKLAWRRDKARKYARAIQRHKIEVVHTSVRDGALSGEMTHIQNKITLYRFVDNLQRTVSGDLGEKLQDSVSTVSVAQSAAKTHRILRPEVADELYRLLAAATTKDRLYWRRCSTHGHPHNYYQGNADVPGALCNELGPTTPAKERGMMEQLSFLRVVALWCEDKTDKTLDIF